jgi:hypothetical protein
VSLECGRAARLSWRGPRIPLDLLRCRPTGPAAGDAIRLSDAAASPEGGSVTLEGTRPGCSYQLTALVGPGGTPWLGVVEFPADDSVFARITKDAGQSAALLVSGERGDRLEAKLERRSGSIDLPPPCYDEAERAWVFEGALSIREPEEKLVVVRRRASGVTVRVRLSIAEVVAAALLRMLGRLRMDSVVQSVVRDKLFNKKDYPRASDWLGTEGPHTYESRRSRRPEMVRNGYFERLAMSRLSGPAAPVQPVLEAFRPMADGYFSTRPAGDRLGSSLYEELLRLQYLDLLVASQLATSPVRAAEVFRGLVSVDYSLVEPTASARPSFEPGEIPILEGPTFWVPVGFDAKAWASYHRMIQFDPQLCQFLCAGIREPRLGDLKRFGKSERVSSEICLEPGAADGYVTVRTTIGLLSPNHLLEIRFLSASGSRQDSFRVDVVHPGGREWTQAMAELLDDGQFVAVDKTETPDRAILWGMVRTTFPRRLLPPGPFRVRVTHRGLPGVPVGELTDVARSVHTREIALSIGSRPAAGGPKR